MSELYIGLMSGTSVDGIDAVIVDLSGPKPNLVGSFYQKYAPELRLQILELCAPGQDEINRLGELDVILGKAFAKATNDLLNNTGIKSTSIKAVGSHGQTIRHHPGRQFTLQIGDPNIIAAETGITTVADFRRRDIAHGGQGAPLVPAFHHSIFAKEGANRIILNIGGIANITVLPASNGNIIGFDTGPGNTLLDAWIELHLQETHDKNGNWGSQGQINEKLLNILLKDPFFSLPPPKSTGREYFNLIWLRQFLFDPIEPVDVQATLTELTASSILNAIEKITPEGEILVCGGGTHNEYLLSRLKSRSERFSIESTQTFGVHPDWVEAFAFAWLAKQTMETKPGNVVSVTGAKKETILGGIYFA